MEATLVLENTLLNIRMHRGAGHEHSCEINSDDHINIFNSASSSLQHPSSLFRDSQLTTPTSPSPSRQQEAKDSLTILHFNDVYNIEGRDKEPVGGAARFKTCLDKFSHLKPLTLFSGDALSPSNSELCFYLSASFYLCLCVQLA